MPIINIPTYGILPGPGVAKPLGAPQINSGIGEALAGLGEGIGQIGGAIRKREEFAKDEKEKTDKRAASVSLGKFYGDLTRLELDLAEEDDPDDAVKAFQKILPSDDNEVLQQRLAEIAPSLQAKAVNQVIGNRRANATFSIASQLDEFQAQDLIDSETPEQAASRFDAHIASRIGEVREEDRASVSNAAGRMIQSARNEFIAKVKREDYDRREISTGRAMLDLVPGVRYTTVGDRKEAARDIAKQSNLDAKDEAALTNAFDKIIEESANENEAVVAQGIIENNRLNPPRENTAEVEVDLAQVKSSFETLGVAKNDPMLWATRYREYVNEQYGEMISAKFSRDPIGAAKEILVSEEFFAGSSLSAEEIESHKKNARQEVSKFFTRSWGGDVLRDVGQLTKDEQTQIASRSPGAEGAAYSAAQGRVDAIEADLLAATDSLLATGEITQQQINDAHNALNQGREVAIRETYGKTTAADEFRGARTPIYGEDKQRNELANAMLPIYMQNISEGKTMGVASELRDITSRVGPLAPFASMVNHLWGKPDIQSKVQAAILANAMFEGHGSSGEVFPPGQMLKMLEFEREMRLTPAKDLPALGDSLMDKYRTLPGADGRAEQEAYKKIEGRIPRLLATALGAAINGDSTPTEVSAAISGIPPAMLEAFRGSMQRQIDHTGGAFSSPEEMAKVAMAEVKASWSEVKDGGWQYKQPELVYGKNGVANDEAREQLMGELDAKYPDGEFRLNFVPETEGAPRWSVWMKNESGEYSPLYGPDGKPVLKSVDPEAFPSLIDAKAKEKENLTSGMRKAGLEQVRALMSLTPEELTKAMPSGKTKDEYIKEIQLKYKLRDVEIEAVRRPWIIISRETNR